MFSKSNDKPYLEFKTTWTLGNLRHLFCNLESYTIKQRSPTSVPQPRTRLWPVQNRASEAVDGCAHSSTCVNGGPAPMQLHLCEWSAHVPFVSTSGAVHVCPPLAQNHPFSSLPTPSPQSWKAAIAFISFQSKTSLVSSPHPTFGGCFLQRCSLLHGGILKYIPDYCVWFGACYGVDME